MNTKYSRINLETKLYKILWKRWHGVSTWQSEEQSENKGIRKKPLEYITDFLVMDNTHIRKLQHHDKARENNTSKN